MPTPINDVQIREIPQPEQTQTKNISYKANPNNTLERVPDADTYSSDNKKTKTILGIVGGAIATAAVVLGAVCYKKGAPKSGEQKKFIDRMNDGWKELIGKGKKSAKAVAKTPVLKPVEEIDGSDFSKLEGEFNKYGDKVIKDADGNVVREFFPSEDGKTLNWVTDFDPNTGNKIKRTVFREDGKTLSSVMDYDPNTGINIKQTRFRKDGKTLDLVADFDPNTGNTIKQTGFREDGKKVHFVIEFDPKIAEKEIRTTYYKEDGTVDRIIRAE